MSRFRRADKPAGGKLIVLLLGLLTATSMLAADIYDLATTGHKRTAEDSMRDQTESPSALLRLADIKPGMTVVDLLAGTGYYSEFLSPIVGPKGRVILINNAAYELGNPSLATRLATNKFTNIEPQSSVN